MEKEKFLIKNEFVSSNETVDIINPYSSEIVKKVYKTNSEHINDSLDYLTNIFPNYKKTPAYLKADLLDAITNKIKQRKEDLAYTITLETGKPIKLSRIEVERAIFTFKTGAEEARRIDGEVIQIDQLKGSEGKFGIVRRFPIGVILAITPWNFPINLVAHKISPALASGNVVLLKPASSSLCCGLEIGKIIKEASEEVGLDYCPVNVITSSGSEVEKFVSDDRVKMISFTGSPVVGWNLKKKLSMQKISLELGGNAGVIVDEDADVKLAVSKIAVGAFAHAGQSCISVQRVFVHTNIYKEFEKLLLEETKKVKFGNPFEDDTLVGPMINETEAKRVEQWIQEAKDTNGKILCGGKREKAMLEPTIISNAKKEININAKEVFAPLLTLKEFDDFKRAVKEVDDSDFGLQAGVFTINIQNAFYAYENIEVGGVVINDVPTYRMDSMPYGGAKQSGIGKEGIKYAIEEMTERKILVL
ncbi:MAG: aldehyde dehydrogenase family protein [Ignavibacteriae bacterium]|nr:aldehyde dehydrogenase family protein [Ignavibacteriota bacterium]